MLRLVTFALLAGMLTSCGMRRKKYENPIAKDSEQPDKILFDKAIGDMEKGRYEVARITLQTLMNTYDTSEYLAKAKLAYADSWFREGGSNGLAQAEAEYKDFILFYPTLEEAAEAQEKVCLIHYGQMEKPDRDMLHALRAEDECRNLIVQFPNSKFVPRAQQLVRNVQEVIAEGEFRRGNFYHTKGSFPAAAARLHGIASHYPLYSQADQANWLLAESYSKMGPGFRNQAGEAYSRIVREYPLSPLVADAKKRLQTLELPVPEADPVAYARMKYELEHRNDPSMVGHMFGIFKKGPDTGAAAKSGAPAMTSLRPTVPVSVPVPADAGAGFTGDVAVQQVGSSSALDTQPDARQATPGAAATGEPGTEPAAVEPSTESAKPTPAAAKQNGKATKQQPKKQEKQKSK